MYFVEKVLRFRQGKKGEEVLIKWTGYKKPTWEPVENFEWQNDAMANANGDGTPGADVS